MITNVKFINSRGQSLDIDMFEPELTGYAITNITGIEPPEVDIKTTALVSGIRHIYNAGFTKLRNIDISILYYEHNNLGLTIKKLRSKLYQLLNGNEKIKIIFTTDETVTFSPTLSVQKRLGIEGYVSKNQGTTFSSACSDSLTIICPDNYFKLYKINADEVYIRYESYSMIDSHTYFLDDIYPGDIETGFNIRMFINEPGTFYIPLLKSEIGFATSSSPYTISGPKINLKTPNVPPDTETSLNNYTADFVVTDKSIRYYHTNDNTGEVVNDLGLIDVESFNNIISIKPTGGNIMLRFELDYEDTGDEIFSTYAYYETLFMGV